VIGSLTPAGGFRQAAETDSLPACAPLSYAALNERMAEVAPKSEASAAACLIATRTFPASSIRKGRRSFRSEL